MKLQTLVEGPQGDDVRTMVFVHGWPDSPQIWDKVIPELKKNYRCVRVYLPNYGHPSDQPKPNAVEWGMDFPEVVDGIAEVMDEHSPNKQVTLVVHDWGCIYGYQVERKFPDRVERMVALDIGGLLNVKKLTVPQLAFLLFYQIFLAVAFLVSRLPNILFLRTVGEFVGTRMVRWMARFLGSPTPLNIIDASVCYPYYYSWKNRILGKGGSSAYRPKCPTLFLWAGQRDFQFFSSGWLKYLDSVPGSSYAAVDCQHWIQWDKPQEVLERMNTFFEKLEQSK